jgi:hypothetical protein
MHVSCAVKLAPCHMLPNVHPCPLLHSSSHVLPGGSMLCVHFAYTLMLHVVRHATVVHDMSPYNIRHVTMSTYNIRRVGCAGSPSVQGAGTAWACTTTWTAGPGAGSTPTGHGRVVSLPPYTCSTPVGSHWHRDPVTCCKQDVASMCAEPFTRIHPITRRRHTNLHRRST